LAQAYCAFIQEKKMKSENSTQSVPQSKILTDRQLVEELLSGYPASRLEKLKMLDERANKKFRLTIQKRIKELACEVNLQPLRVMIQTCNEHIAANCREEEVHHE